MGLRGLAELQDISGVRLCSVNVADSKAERRSRSRSVRESRLNHGDSLISRSSSIQPFLARIECMYDKGAVAEKQYIENTSLHISVIRRHLREGCDTYSQQPTLATEPSVRSRRSIIAPSQ
jgi:hypothetical protein